MRMLVSQSNKHSNLLSTFNRAFFFFYNSGPLFFFFCPPPPTSFFPLILFCFQYLLTGGGDQWRRNEGFGRDTRSELRPDVRFGFGGGGTLAAREAHPDAPAEASGAPPGGAAATLASPETPPPLLDGESQTEYMARTARQRREKRLQEVFSFSLAPHSLLLAQSLTLLNSSFVIGGFEF